MQANKFHTSTLENKMKRVLLNFISCGLITCSLGIIFGLLGAHFYIHTSSKTLMGLSFQQLRPLHTNLVVCWIYLVGTAGLCHYLFSLAREKGAEKVESLILKTKTVFILWIFSGILMMLSVYLNHFSGKEYISFPLYVSLPILLGWIVLAFSFFQNVGFSFSTQPVYVWMWAVSMGLFIFTFLEGHLHLLSIISSKPLLDISIQWKSYGALVGSFNLLVYGALSYFGEKINKNKKHANSNLVFILFFISILNSFTNYGHHTYHLPQSHYIKWFSFIVSMSEIIILLKVCSDVSGILGKRTIKNEYKSSLIFFSMTTLWTLIQLLGSIIISIPPLNTLIHGTHVITAHAMGTMMGIDSMVLLGVCTYLLEENDPKLSAYFSSRFFIIQILIFNALLFIFYLLLNIKGFVFGFTRYLQASTSTLDQVQEKFPILFLTIGSLLAFSILGLIFSILKTYFFKLRIGSFSMHLLPQKD